MATINGMYILVESEQPGFEVDITEQPIEDGINLIDHVQRKAQTLSISGFIVGEEAAEIREQIKSLMYSGTVVDFAGRTLFTGLIASFSTTHDHTVANGYAFSLSLKEVVIAQSSFVETLPAPIRAQAAPVISSGRKQTKKKEKGKGKDKKPVEKVKFKAGSPWAE